MAITKQDAVNAQYGDLFHGLSYNGKKMIRVRVSGKCQTWKTRPTEFRLPVKYGMFENGEITHRDLDRWTKGDIP